MTLTKEFKETIKYNAIIVFIVIATMWIMMFQGLAIEGKTLNEYGETQKNHQQESR